MMYVECELWTYYGDPRPMNMTARFPIPPQEGDDVSVAGKRYTVIRRRIAHDEPLRLYVALDDDYDGFDDVMPRRPSRVKQSPVIPIRKTGV